MRPRILVVDDEPSIRRAIELVLEDCEIVHADSYADAARELEEDGAFDAALIDKNLPDGSGVDLIQVAHEHCPGVPVLIITGYPTLESAIDAVSKGAFDYVLKPFDTMDLRHKVNKAVEKTRLEAQLRRAERLETVGRFASNIAHDLNNLLTVFTTSSGFLHEFLTKHEATLDVAEPLEDVQAITHASNTAAGLTRQLLTFSSRQVLTPQDIALNEVVEQLRRTMLRTLEGRITVELELADGLPTVRMDPGQCEQLVLNLVLNARDALPDGGRIVVSTMRLEGTPPRAQLCVRDDGTGMDEATLARVFEPFFTTKDHGRGTGLGLASVARIVESLGGTVGVDSKLGVGTYVTLELPGVVRSHTPASSLPAPPPHAGARVSIVERDGAVRASLARVLRDAGYEVSSGKDAAALLAEEASPRLLVFDVSADPSLSEMVAMLKRSAPESRLLLVTTRAFGGALEQELSVGGRPVECVAKPFSRKALLNAVGRALS